MDDFNATCLGCRYPLHQRSPSTECPECGRPFDRTDPATFNRVLSDPIRIVQMKIERAVMLRLALETEGIPTAMHEESGGLIGYYDIPQATVWVNRGDEDRARQIHAAMPPPDAVDTAPPSIEEEWRCAECEESVDADFDVCWNCGAER